VFLIFAVVGRDRRSHDAPAHAGAQRGAPPTIHEVPRVAARGRANAKRCPMSSWVIDKVHSHVGFSVKHMMVSTVRGQFKEYSGTVGIDASDFTRSTFEGSVEVASIDTGNADRDNHLRTNDFFDAPNHPKITFKSAGIEAKGDGAYVVNGDLTIRGVTKPVAFEVEFHGTGKNPWTKTVAGFHAQTTLNRKDFGVNFNAALETGGVLIAEKVKIEIDVEATLAE
jgi:polyisoprenoid-binding protein YceI